MTADGRRACLPWHRTIAFDISGVCCICRRPFFRRGRQDLASFVSSETALVYFEMVSISFQFTTKAGSQAADEK